LSKQTYKLHLIQDGVN